jgi:hypothetical protein
MPLRRGDLLFESGLPPTNLLEALANARQRQGFLEIEIEESSFLPGEVGPFPDEHI